MPIENEVNDIVSALQNENWEGSKKTSGSKRDFYLALRNYIHDHRQLNNRVEIVTPVSMDELVEMVNDIIRCKYPNKMRVLIPILAPEGWQLTIIDINDTKIKKAKLWDPRANYGFAMELTDTHTQLKSVLSNKVTIDCIPGRLPFVFYTDMDFVLQAALKYYFGSHGLSIFSRHKPPVEVQAVIKAEDISIELRDAVLELIRKNGFANLPANEIRNRP